MSSGLVGRSMHMPLQMPHLTSSDEDEEYDDEIDDENDSQSRSSSSSLTSGSRTSSTASASTGTGSATASPGRSGTGGSATATYTGKGDSDTSTGWGSRSSSRSRRSRNRSRRGDDDNEEEEGEKEQVKNCDGETKTETNMGWRLNLGSSPKEAKVTDAAEILADHMKDNDEETAQELLERARAHQRQYQVLSSSISAFTSTVSSGPLLERANQIEKQKQQQATTNTTTASSSSSRRKQQQALPIESSSNIGRNNRKNKKATNNSSTSDAKGAKWNDTKGKNQVAPTSSKETKTQEQEQQQKQKQQQEQQKQEQHLEQQKQEQQHQQTPVPATTSNSNTTTPASAAVASVALPSDYRSDADTEVISNKMLPHTEQMIGRNSRRKISNKRQHHYNHINNYNNTNYASKHNNNNPNNTIIRVRRGSGHGGSSSRGRKNSDDTNTNTNTSPRRQLGVRSTSPRPKPIPEDSDDHGVNRSRSHHGSSSRSADYSLGGGSSSSGRRRFRSHTNNNNENNNTVIATKRPTRALSEHDANKNTSYTDHITIDSNSNNNNNDDKDNIIGSASNSTSKNNNDDDIAPKEGSFRVSWKSDPKKSFSDWRLEIAYRDRINCRPHVDVYHLHKNVVAFGIRKSERILRGITELELRGVLHSEIPKSSNGRGVVGDGSASSKNEPKTRLDVPTESQARAVPMVLDFLYFTKELKHKLTADMACNMFKVAELLEVPALEKAIGEFYMKNLQLKNLGDFLSLATKARADKLLTICKAKIGQMITEQPELSGLVPPKFMADILGISSRQLEEVRVLEPERYTEELIVSQSLYWSKAACICASANESILTARLFERLTASESLPYIDVSATPKLLSIESQFLGTGVFFETNSSSHTNKEGGSQSQQSQSQSQTTAPENKLTSLQKRCVESIANDFKTFQNCFDSQEALADSLRHLPSNILAEILLKSRQ